MSVCAKFQLSIWSRSDWKVCGGGGEHMATMSNLNPSYLELLSVELSLDHDSFVR